MSVLPTDIYAFGALAMPGYDGSTTLNGALTASTNPIVVTANSTFPQTGEFPIIIDSEIMWVTQGAGSNSWTVIRGMVGTTAAIHSSGATVTSVAGGPIDFLTGVGFTDIVAGHSLSAISSSASDTKTIMSVSGRNSGGTFITGQNVTLTGQTAVSFGAQTYDRLIALSLGLGTTLVTTALTAAATSMTVSAATNFPASGNYNILMGREVMTVTAGQGTATWTITRGVNGTTATTHAVGDNVYLMPFGDVAVYDSTAVIPAHTLQSAAQSTGTTPALATLQAGDGATVSIGQIIIITNNTPAGVQSMIRTITNTTSYGTNVVAVDRDWDTLPTSSTTYNVVNGWKLPFKLGSGVANTVAIAQTNMQRFLWGAVADVAGGSSRTFYEKIFVVNNNTATDFTSATIQIASDSPSLPGSAALDIGLTSGANDTASVANRQTSPGSVTFVTQPSAINVIANSQSLVHGVAPNAAGSQAVWMRATLPAGTAAYKGAATLRANGNTI